MGVSPRGRRALSPVAGTEAGHGAAETHLWGPQDVHAYPTSPASRVRTVLNGLGPVGHAVRVFWCDKVGRAPAPQLLERLGSCGLWSIVVLCPTLFSVLRFCSPRLL